MGGSHAPHAERDRLDLDKKLVFNILRYHQCYHCSDGGAPCIYIGQTLHLQALRGINITEWTAGPGPCVQQMREDGVWPPESTGNKNLRTDNSLTT